MNGCYERNRIRMDYSNSQCTSMSTILSIESLPISIYMKAATNRVKLIIHSPHWVRYELLSFLYNHRKPDITITS